MYEQVVARHPEDAARVPLLAEPPVKDDKARDARQMLKQGSVAYESSEGRRVQMWAKQVEADFEEELK